MWKFCGIAEFPDRNSTKPVFFHKIFIPGNLVNFLYFTQSNAGQKNDLKHPRFSGTFLQKNKITYEGEEALH